MKTFLFAYIVIGLFLTPFIYSNNADGYRDGRSKSYKIGRAIGAGAIWWPSYLFSIEPEIDSSTVESFRKSVLDIAEYRSKKMYTERRYPADLEMMVTALGYCLARESVDKENILNLYHDIFFANTEGKEIQRIRAAIMEKMSGYDFADIVEAGAECEENLGEDMVAATAGAIIENVVRTDTRQPSYQTSYNMEPISENPTSTTNISPSGEAQSEADRVFSEAAKRAENEYTAKWESIKKNPAKFLTDCKTSEVEPAVKYGGVDPAEAERLAEVTCDRQLTELNACMHQPNVNASNCFTNIFERGD